MPVSPPTPCATPATGDCRRIAGPCGLVIFGVTGDLSRKKLMPAVYDLANRGLLPPGFAWSGFARRDWEDQDFAQIVHDSVKEHARTPFREEVWQQLAEGIRFVAGDFSDDDGVRPPPQDDPWSSTRLAAPAATTPSTCRSRRSSSPTSSGSSRSTSLADGPGRRLAPGHHREAVRPRPRERPGAQPASSARCSPRGRSSGSTTTSARRRSRTSWRCASRTRSSSRLERQLRRPRADHDGRGRRDRRPGRLLRRHRRRPRRHPEPPAPAAGADRDGGAGLLRRGRPAASRRRRSSPPYASRRTSPLHTARGQYAAGWQGGEQVDRLPRGGRQLARQSTTETYAAIRLDIDTRRWAGVPFYLRTGKRLGRRVTEIAIVFKRAPHLPFEATATEELGQNALVIRVQPDEGISLRFGSKVPGTADGGP